ncbi:hypothetical protein [Pseudobacteriovorax antillogorgiicola]|uniref:Outer membrane protein TolC n=1 Tax=Pseudobacteriovorax antillogorgiicola TaxID=1513793 RepID=A0A1Y6BYJ3_9BACT|nr:hypothetical protein [Pseudobacteriovorax antillogorgiicola]TCS52962.1 hypothetical protein EDD56_10813 [Pseudobacteriovorax antillogorgiicola]SMF27499.1 hypothetical protein SAMN06296036_108234 [Pseudobacteriovorax antillogorgiicola]
MKRKLLALMFGAVGYSAAASAAIPSMSQSCSGRLPEIQHPDRGSGVLFDETCRTAYVLPPETGDVSLGSVARNANLQFCPAVLQAGQTATSLANSASHIASMIEEMISDYEPMREQIRAAADELNEAEVESQEISARLMLAQERFTNLRLEYSQAKSDLEMCELLSPGECSELEAAELEKKLAIVAQKQVVDNLRIEQIESDSRVSRARYQKTRLESEYTDGLAPLTSLYGQLETINGSITNLYLRWAPVEGATAQLVYRVKWADLINKYNAANPELRNRGVRFAPVTVTSGQFFATTKIASLEEIQASIPAVLSAVVPGASPYGPNHLDNGDVTIDASVTDIDQRDPSLNNTMLGFASGSLGSISGQVRLSLAGACPYFPEGLTSPDKDTINKEELSAHIAVNAVLGYDVKVHRKYRASFNMANLTSRIESMSQKKRWFFSSKNVHKLVVENNHSSWFNITFDIDSSDFTFTADEQSEITKEVKADLVKRALDNIAVISGKSPDLPELGKTGFNNQDKLRCNKWYCFGFNYVLGIANGFFGTKKSVSEFKQANRAWVRDSVSQMKVIKRQHILSFTKLDDEPVAEDDNTPVVVR